MFSSAEHEICPTTKSQITNNCKTLLNIAVHENVCANKYKNATIVVSRENCMLSWVEHKKIFFYGSGLTHLP